MHFETLNLREVVVFLVAAGVVVPLAHRLRISPILGFLTIGLAIGPYGLGRFTDAAPWLGYALITDLEGVRALAELGVVFLLFMIGLELSVERLWAMRRLVFGLGGAQVLVTGAVIAAIASLFDNKLPAAIALGAAFALSSTAIVMGLLVEKRRLGTATGQTSLAILLCQDLAVLPILFMVSAFAAQGGQSVPLSLAWALAQALIAVAVILVAGRLVIRPLFRFIGRTASREMFLALVLLVIIGTGMATQAAGLSMALGAFLAGLLFAGTEYRHEVEVDIEPFKGLLLGLFFISVGTTIDLLQVAANPFWLAASLIGLFLIKGPIVYVLARLFREPRSVALETALLLGQGGEFAFVIVGSGAALGLIPPETAQFMLIVAGLTMIATPPVANIARKLARAVEIGEVSHGVDRAGATEEISGHVIVIGYGRVGQMLGALLEQQELPLVAIDIDPTLVSDFRSEGTSIFYGDAARPDILRKFGAERAAALVVTMDSPVAADRVVAAARRYWPSLAIYARARDAVHARHLIAQGASHAVPETTEASLQLSEMVLVGAGVPDHAARELIEDHRQAEQAAIDESRESGRD
jgi:monovalent cation:proton antiporter-2 (CPA2) family protein